MRRNLQVILCVLVIVGLIGAGLLLQVQSGVAQAPVSVTPTNGDQRIRTVTVSGSGQVTQSPDQAVIQLGVQTQADTASQALALNAQSMLSLTNGLRSQGIISADIHTLALSLFPRYEQTPAGGQRLVGYTASNMLQVHVRDLSVLGELLDTAVRDGANTIDGVQFDLSDTSAAVDQARSAAMADARHKAEQLAGLAGSGLGQILTINEVNASPRPIMALVGGPAPGASVPVQPGTLSIDVDIQVTWELTGTPVVLTPTVTSTPATADTETPTPVVTATETPTPIATDTATPTPVVTGTETPTLVATDTATLTPVATDTRTPIPFVTATETETPLAPTEIVSPTHIVVPSATMTITAAP